MNMEVFVFFIYKIIALIVNVTIMTICLKRRLSIPLTVIVFSVASIIISVIDNHTGLLSKYYLTNGICFLPLIILLFKDGILRKLFLFFAQMFVSIAIFNFFLKTFSFFIEYKSMLMYIFLLVFVSLTFTLYIIFVFRYGKDFLNILIGNGTKLQWILYMLTASIFYIVAVILEKNYIAGNMQNYIILIFSMWSFVILCYAIIKTNKVLEASRIIYETEIEKLQLQARVHYDKLTGIYNRHYLDEKISYLIKMLSRTGENISIFMIDLDFFKKYNDNYGHSQGDVCLKAVASSLASSILREDDFVARYGGEEFIVVLSNTDETGAKIIAERMLENIRALQIPHEKNEIYHYVTISIGITKGKVSHTQEAEDYIKQADKALYLTKQNGRNGYTYLDMEDMEE